MLGDSHAGHHVGSRRDRPEGGAGPEAVRSRIGAPGSLRSQGKARKREVTPRQPLDLMEEQQALGIKMTFLEDKDRDSGKG